MNKVNITVKKEIKMDGRTNNTGRPVNNKSAGQARLAKQAFYADVHNKFVSGNEFKMKGTSSNTYKYSHGDNDGLGCIVDGVTGFYQCNVSYVGRTKVECYSFTLGKKVNVTLNLKTLEFVS